MGRCLVAVVAATLGAASGVGCNPGKDGGPSTERPAIPATDWVGREVVPEPPPPGWSVWDSGDGIRVATPAELRPQPLPGGLTARAEHDGARYQVTVLGDQPGLTGTIQPAEFFEVFLDNFAASAVLRRDGQTERLRVGGHPAAQARFTDGPLRAVVRVVRVGDRTVSLAVRSGGSVKEGNPSIGGFLNSLQVGRPGR